MVAVKAGFVGPSADGTTPLANLLDTRRVETWYACGGRSGILAGFDWSVVAGQMQISLTAGESLVAERDGTNAELRRGYLAWDDAARIVQFGAASPAARNDAVVIAVVDVEDGAQGTGAIGVGGHLVVVPGVSGVTAARTDTEIRNFLGRGGWHRYADVAIPVGSTQIATGNVVFKATKLNGRNAIGGAPAAGWTLQSQDWTPTRPGWAWVDILATRTGADIVSGASGDISDVTVMSGLPAPASGRAYISGNRGDGASSTARVATTGSLLLTSGPPSATLVPTGGAVAFQGEYCLLA